ncbi:MAG: DMT family transporter [Sulfurisoma sp.]|nr:DMT family transporter [Sulfurisoma sp.]
MPDTSPGRGIVMMLAALFCFALLDATSKHLSQTFSVPLLVWARYTFHLLLMVVFLAPSRRGRLLATRRPVLQVVRALLLVGVTGFAMAAFRIMPLAETTAILFVTPLFVALLAGPLLGEKVGRLRWAAVGAGFVGMLLIARPGGALVTEGIVLCLTAAACYALYQIQTRQLSPTEDTVTMVFYTALVGTVAMSLALPWIWGGPTPTWPEALMIASLGIYGGTGHFLLIGAFRHATASTLSPFLYVQLIWATLLGWLVYDALPDVTTFAGMAIIAAAGIVLAWHARPRMR